MKKNIFLIIILMILTSCGEVSIVEKEKIFEKKVDNNDYKIFSFWTYHHLITNICQNGYEYVLVVGRNATSITQAFEFVDGVSRPKVCE